MSDHYARDPAKAKARETFEETAERLLPRKRREATVMYLAGTNSKESELYDRLGISRENRLILEYKKSLLRKVRRENRGVKVVHMSTHEFLNHGFKDYPQYFPLWCCGLDYEYKLNNNVIMDLENIARHELLIDGGMLYTNIVGQRENDDMKEAYAEHLFARARDSYLFRNHFSEEFKRALGIVRNGNGSEKESHQEAVREMLRHMPSEKLSLLRNLAVVSSIQETLLHTPRNCLFLDVYCPGSSWHIEQHGLAGAESTYTGAAVPEVSHTPEGIRIAFDSLPLRLLFKNMRVNSDAIQKSASLYAAGRALERHAMKYYRSGNLDLLAMLFHLVDSKGYVPNAMDSYSYISNRNTMMLFDVMHVRKCRQAVREVMQHIGEKELRVLYGAERPYLASESVRTGDVEDSAKTLLWRLKKESERHTHWLEETAPFLDHFDPYTVGRKHYTRKSLASAHRPALTSVQARRCAIGGWTNEQIEAKFIVSKEEWRSLAAFRANVTTGRIKGMGKV